MKGDDEENVEDPGRQDRSQNSGMMGQEQITLDHKKGDVTLIDESKNDTAEIMTTMTDGQSMIENICKQAIQPWRLVEMLLK